MSKGIFPQYEDIDFDVEKEVWNVYELEDGRHRVTLKMRGILTKVLKPRIMTPEPPLIGVPAGAKKKMEYMLSFRNIVIVSSCPTELMKAPSEPIPPTEFQQLPRQEINFIPFNEDWNIYRVHNGPKIRVKLVVSSVEKVEGRYDQFGYPVYQVQSTNAIAPVSPPRRRKRKR